MSHALLIIICFNDLFKKLCDFICWYKYVYNQLKIDNTDYLKKKLYKYFSLRWGV